MFLQQFELLRQKTPHIELQCVQNENSPYCQYEEYFKRSAEIIGQMKQGGEWGRWFDSTYPEVLTYGF